MLQGFECSLFEEVSFPHGEVKVLLLELLYVPCRAITISEGSEESSCVVGIWGLFSYVTNFAPNHGNFICYFH